jgi:signal peptide peptidase SppA
MIFYIQILSLLFSIAGTIVLAMPFFKTRRALEDDLLLPLDKVKQPQDGKHYYSRVGFFKDRKMGLLGLSFLLIGFLLQLLALTTPKIPFISFSDCNVQDIKLHGQLFTYRNSASDGTGQLSKDVASSEEIVAAINKANSDSSIKAILLEIDSTGGSGVAGWEISQALKHSNKPTVALIRESGDSAAYWAASGAKYIVASANSDVGDIGVTMSYVGNSIKNTQDGLTFYQLSAGKFKDAGNPDKPLTPEEQQLFMRDLKIEYDNFVKDVSVNRSLDVAKVTALADGSSMLGQMAKDNGLIDQVGGIYDVQNYLNQKLKTDIKICW